MPQIEEKPPTEDLEKAYFSSINAEDDDKKTAETNMVNPNPEAIPPEISKTKEPLAGAPQTSEAATTEAVPEKKDEAPSAGV